MTNGIGRFGVRSYVAPLPTIWNNLTHYYSGDNTANDLKGTSNGTLINGTTYGSGKINNGFDLDGINDYISFPTNTFKPTGDFSISFWMLKKNNATPLYMAFTEIGQPYYGNGMFGYNYNGGFAFEVNGGNDIVTPFIPNDVWTHIVITHKASTNYKIYTNGVLATPVSGNYPNTKTTSVNPNFSSNNIGMTIGAGLGGGYPACVKFDEIALFDDAELTQSQITELYNAGAGKQYVAPVVTAPTSTYTTRTAAFATATGITDTTILNALNTFDTGLISNGLDTKMKAVYPFVGGTSTTCKYNFMNAVDTNAAFRLQFNGGLYFSTTGVQGGGVNGYANTYFTGSNWNNINNNSMGIYTRTTQGALSQCDIGAFSVPYSNNFLASYYSDSKFYAVINGVDNSSNLTYTNTESKGFYIANRTSSTVLNGWKNGTKIGTNTVAPVNLLNVPLYLFAYSNQGSPQLISTKELQFAFMGDGLSDTEASNLSTLVHNMQTTLGRNY